MLMFLICMLPAPGFRNFGGLCCTYFCLPWVHGGKFEPGLAPEFKKMEIQWSYHSICRALLNSGIKALHDFQILSFFPFCYFFVYILWYIYICFLFNNWALKTIFLQIYCIKLMTLFLCPKISLVTFLFYLSLVQPMIFFTYCLKESIWNNS